MDGFTYGAPAPSALSGSRGSEGDLLVRLLKATELRAKIISANVANQNTPGYTRREVRFEDLLRQAVESGRDARRIEPEIVLDTVSPTRPDGNNVNLELELNSMRENRLLYESYAAILQGRFALKQLAVTEGR